MEDKGQEIMHIHNVFALLGFPIWIRITHYINLLFIGLLIRSGIQITGAHPRLYWNDGYNPDSAWLKLTTKKVPKDKLYTSMDDEEPVSPRLALQKGKQSVKPELTEGQEYTYYEVLEMELGRYKALHCPCRAKSCKKLSMAQALAPLPGH